MRIALLLLTMMAIPAIAKNAADDQLRTFSDDQKRTVLAGVVRSAGDQCATVTKTLYRGRDKQEHAYYAVLCNNNRDYQVQIKSDATGSTSVLSCAVLKKMNTACWTKF